MEGGQTPGEFLDAVHRSGGGVEVVDEDSGVCQVERARLKLEFLKDEAGGAGEVFLGEVDFAVALVTRAGNGDQGVAEGGGIEWRRSSGGRLDVEPLDGGPQVVIAGQGRTGTTHLHNLMSSDRSFRSMPYWESLEPVPPRAEQGVVHPDFRDDPRYVRCVEKLAGLNGALPYFKRMHDMYPEHVHEEIALLTIPYGGMSPETMAVMPTWRDWYLASDQTPFYEYMKTMLKVMTFLGRGTEREADRWLLKSPQHVERLHELITVFPDATVVCTHRDPVAVAKSMATMLTYTSRMSRDPAKLADVGRYWIDRMGRMLHGMADQRHLLPAAQSIDVKFDEFMADDIAMVRRIYELADHPCDDGTGAGMHAYMAEHPRGLHGSVSYHIEEDFGVDPAALAEEFRFYVDRFGVTVEPPH